jgi:hypothetical protein
VEFHYGSSCSDTSFRLPYCQDTRNILLPLLGFDDFRQRLYNGAASDTKTEKTSLPRQNIPFLALWSLCISYSDSPGCILTQRAGAEPLQGMDNTGADNLFLLHRHITEHKIQYEDKIEGWLNHFS